MRPWFITSLFMTLILAVSVQCFGSEKRSSQTERNETDKTSNAILGLENQLQLLKLQLDNIEKHEKQAPDILSLAQTVLGNAQEAMKSSQAEVHAIETAWKIGGMFLAIIVTLLGIFGYKEYKDIKCILDAYKQKLDDHIADAQVTMKAFRLSFEMTKGAILAFDRCKVALDKLTIWLDSKQTRDASEAARRIAISESLKAVEILEGLIPAGIRNKIGDVEQKTSSNLVDKQKQDNIDLIVQKGDPPILGWTYQIYGLAKGNIVTLSAENPSGNSYAEPLSFIEFGLKLWPETSSGWYNAACFACHLGEREKTLSYLRQATKRRPSIAADASKDPDFKSLWEDAEFMIITHQES